MRKLAEAGYRDSPSSQNQKVNEMSGLPTTLLPVATIEASVWL
jgi:hypothetical protein